MNRNIRNKQDSKLRKDDKQKQKESCTQEDVSEKTVSASCISNKERSSSVGERICIAAEKNASEPCSSKQTETQIQSSVLGKRQTPASNEIIAYVEHVSPSKRNRRDTMDYSDVLLQVEGANKCRAVCFSSSKRQLLLEKKNNKTAVKISKYSLAKDSETIYINDMTYISKPRPEEYSFQYEESLASVSHKWLSLKEAIELCEPMTVVNIKAKVLDVGETQIVSSKQLKMAETIIFDGETTSTLILWEKDVTGVQKGKAYNFEQVRLRVTNDEKIFNTTRNTVITVNNDTHLNDVESSELCVESSTKLINIAKIEMIEEFSVSKACLKCKKHIIQYNSQYLLKCDFCNYMMRQENCKSYVIVKIIVKEFSEETESKELHLTVFHDNIAKLLNTEEIYDENFVCSSLLQLENLQLTFNVKCNTVVKIEQL